MATKTKKQITPFELAEKYLHHIGVPEKDYKKVLIPSKYNATIICAGQPKSNILRENKLTKKSSHQTHIAIPNYAANLYYTPTQMGSLGTASSGIELKRKYILFNGNIEAMLDRRVSKANPDIDTSVSPSKKYPINGTIAGFSNSWLQREGSGGIQVHIGKHDDKGKASNDSPEFFDFRLGIMIDDFLAIRNKWLKIILYTMLFNH